MPNTIDQLSAQREAVLKELQDIDRLRRGTLSSQTFTKKQGDKSVTQGPYFNLQGFHKGKKFNHHIPADKRSEVQQHVDNFKRFQELSDQCITLTDEITKLAEGLPDSKKNSRPRKFRKNSSKKQKPS